MPAVPYDPEEDRDPEPRRIPDIGDIVDDILDRDEPTPGAV